MSRFFIFSITALTSAFCLLPSDFAPALPGYEFSFPRDHSSHDEYKTEWWYYTGHLRTDDGRRYGFELTFFRVGVVPGKTDNPLCPPGRGDCPPSTSAWDLHSLALAHF